MTPSARLCATLAGLSLGLGGVGAPGLASANPIVVRPGENDACNQVRHERGCRRCGSVRELDPLRIEPGDPGLDACREYLDDGYELRCRIGGWGNYYVVCRDPDVAGSSASTPATARPIARRVRPPAAPEPASGCAIGARSSRGGAAFPLGVGALGVLWCRRRVGEEGRADR